MKSKEDKIILDEKKSVSRERIRRRSETKVKMGWGKLDLNPLTKVIMVRVKADSFRKLKKIAEKECRTVASVVRQAIKEYLEKR